MAFWQGYQDSNLDKQIQNLLCCHYTISLRSLRVLWLALFRAEASITTPGAAGQPEATPGFSMTLSPANFSSRRFWPTPGKYTSTSRLSPWPKPCMNTPSPNLA